MKYLSEKQRFKKSHYLCFLLCKIGSILKQDCFRTSLNIFSTLSLFMFEFSVVVNTLLINEGFDRCHLKRQQ